MYLTQVFAVGALMVVGSFGAESQAAQTLPTGVLAAPTAEYNFDFNYGAAPEPTTAPDVPLAELVRRQAGATTVCGLLSANTSWSYTCANNWVCGYNTLDRNNFGCCSAYSGNSVSGCFFPTTCYDSSVATTMSCTQGNEPCTWSSLYCTKSAYPYCGAFIEAGLTALNCFASPRYTYQLIPVSGAGSSVPSVTVVSSTSLSSSLSSSLSRTSITSSAARPSSSSSSSNEVIPFTNQQQSVSSSSSTTQSSTSRASNGVAPTSGMASESLFGFLMSLVLLVL